MSNPRRIILTRKGCDSGKSSGGMASPILPCGCLCSVPIPYPKGGIPYSEVRFGRRSLQDICIELNGEWQADSKAHLDPDLRENALANRPSGWSPAFGQTGIAERHLFKQGVSKGDLFIFFGWFRETEMIQGRLQFSEKDTNGRHIIYGWLTVEDVFEVGKQELATHLQFLAEHAHTKFVKTEPNRIYIGSKGGAGVFPKLAPELVLTKPGCEKRSIWKLPPAFGSVYERPMLTYHKNKEKRWYKENDDICLKTVGRGQEFVLDCEEHPAVRDHFLNLIESNREVSGCPHGFPPQARILGSAKGEFTVPDDFNDPSPEIEDLFYK